MKKYSVSEKGRAAMRRGEDKALGKYHMTEKDRKDMSKGMKEKDESNRSTSIGLSHSGDTGYDANGKAAKAFRSV